MLKKEKRLGRLEEEKAFLRWKLGPTYVPHIKARKIPHLVELRTGSQI